MYTYITCTVKKSTSVYVQSKLVHFACQWFFQECFTQSVLLSVLLGECPCKNVSLKLSYHEALPRVLLGECPWNNG